MESKKKLPNNTEDKDKCLVSVNAVATDKCQINFEEIKKKLVENWFRKK